MFPRMCAMLLQEMNPRFADKKKKIVVQICQSFAGKHGKNEGRTIFQ